MLMSSEQGRRGNVDRYQIYSKLARVQLPRKVNANNFHVMFISFDEIQTSVVKNKRLLDGYGIVFFSICTLCFNVCLNFPVVE